MIAAPSASPLVSANCRGLLLSPPRPDVAIGEAWIVGMEVMERDALSCWEGSVTVQHPNGYTQPRRRQGAPGAVGEVASGDRQHSVRVFGQVLWTAAGVAVAALVQIGDKVYWPLSDLRSEPGVYPVRRETSSYTVSAIRGTGRVLSATTCSTSSWLWPRAKRRCQMMAKLILSNRGCESQNEL